MSEILNEIISSVKRLPKIDPIFGISFSLSAYPRFISAHKPSAMEPSIDGLPCFGIPFLVDPRQETECLMYRDEKAWLDKVKDQREYDERRLSDHEHS